MSLNILKTFYFEPKTIPKIILERHRVLIRLKIKGKNPIIFDVLHHDKKQDKDITEQ